MRAGVPADKAWGNFSPFAAKAPLSCAIMPTLPVIPGYELLARLGGGPLTAVYSARELATDTPCAVKVVREDWEDEATAVKLLQREARAGLGVRHAHLVRFREAHVT